MTIDEAIKQEKEKAVDCRQGAEVVKNMTYATWERENLPKQYIERAEYHEQLAEWLEELKKYQSYKPVDKEFYKAGYTMAIDDFADKLKEYTYGRTNGIYVEIPLYKVDELAEQLKEGGVDG